MVAEARVDAEGRIAEGRLECRACSQSYPVVGHIPRFVPSSNYAAGFGLEWTIHNRTQYDDHSGVSLSEERFFNETRWPRRLEGEIVIEAGSGSGRFTEHAASTGATVLSFDYSDAVDANYRSNGKRPNLLLVQADVFNMPFRDGCADKLFCFGVLQHTPDPKRAFLSLPPRVKPGGEVVADVYIKSFAKYVLGTKYWVRPLTRRVPPDRLYGLTQRYVAAMWPLARRVRRIPRIGKALNWRLLIGDYGDQIGNDAVLREWAFLDTFDMLAPRFDSPQRLSTARRWCEEAGLHGAEVALGYNGIELRGRRPPQTMPIG